jgi:hypothetical protein
MSVTYNRQTSFTVSAAVMPTHIRVDFINQVSGNTYHVRVELGRYFVAGNRHVHTLKLLDANMHILGSATVDESAGTADGLGVLILMRTGAFWLLKY